MYLNVVQQSLWCLPESEFALLDDSGGLIFAREGVDGFCSRVDLTRERLERLAESHCQVRLDEAPEPFKLGFYRAFSASQTADGAHFHEGRRSAAPEYRDKISMLLYLRGWEAGVGKAREVFSSSCRPTHASAQDNWQQLGAAAVFGGQTGLRAVCGAN
jgi:hypothetical protein